MRNSKKLFLVSVSYLAIIGLLFVSLCAASSSGKGKEFDASAFNDFSSAVSDPRTIGNTIVVTHTVNVENLVIPKDRKLRIANGGKIAIATGGTLVINGHFDTKASQVFTGNGIVIFGKGSVKEIYPQWWGAVADGTSDCYAAMKAMAASVNASGGGNIVFPKGEYYVGQYKISSGPNRNDVSDIVFENCSGLHISGYNAKISVMGRFNRPADRQVIRPTRILKYSYTNCVSPLVIRNCSDVVIEGLEINGNVDKMTRDAGVVESSGHGIIVQGGSKFLLKNLFVHHFQSDGIYLTGFKAERKTYPCRKGSLDNVKSTNNARQGLSIIQARNITCTDSIFADTGLTGGAYGRHAPAAGVDIEPHYSMASPKIKLAENTGRITFTRCRFENNSGSQFNAAYAKSTDTVSLKECRIDAKSSKYRYAVIFAVNGGIMENCTIDTGAGSFYAGWGKLGGLQKITIRGSSIRSRMQGIVSQNDAEMLIENNKIINYYDEPDARRNVVFINNPKCIFRNNQLFMSKKVLSGGKASQVASYLKMKESSGNTFDTDMAAMGNVHFTTNYGKDTLVVNDRYPATGVYRPYANAKGYENPYSNSPRVF